MFLATLPRSTSEPLQIRIADVALDALPAVHCDRIASLAAHLFDVPMVLIGLFDQGRMRIITRHGLDDQQVAALMQADLVALLPPAFLWVPAADDAAGTTAHPLFAAVPGLHFYAAVPLHGYDGRRIGTLVLLDTRPHQLTPWAEHTLTELAALVVEQVELQIAVHTLSRQHAQDTRPAGSLSALQDKLTELPNRALFLDRLERALVRARRRDDYAFAVLFLDIDRFKTINESLGYAMGDQLLIAIAQRLMGCLRVGDSIARVGGDEFALLLDDSSDVSEAFAVAERIHHVLAAPLTLDGHEIVVTVSIGIALSSSGYEQPETLLRDADIALYRAKARGKNCHELFDTAMYARVSESLRTESELRRALERHELCVYYQPLIELATGKIVGFEALVRWEHPRRGLLLPAEFLPVAEESGLIVPLGNWVFREACRQMRAWQEHFPCLQHLAISVNLSSKHFSHPKLLDQVQGILAESGLDPHSLNLEITEETVIENSEAVTATLTRLRAMNVQVSIDDFGTGYSSLSYLHRFPTNALKVDRSFVSRVNSQGENVEIVKAIVMLAHNLGMYVVAEGIETEAQLEWMRALGCEYGQGFLFARPLPAAVAEAMLAATCCPPPQPGA